MMLRLAAIIACLVALGGCLGAGDEAPAPSSPGEGATTVPTSTEGAGNGDDGSVQAPVLAAGDWWRWEVTARGYAPFEVTTVVAGAGPDSYALAVTDAQQALPAHIFHVPPMGDVSRPGLQWMAHGHPMDLLQFPLADGKQWTGSIEGQAIDFIATAVARDGRTVFSVEGWFEDGYPGPRYVYDPALRMFSEVHVHYGSDEPFSSARVVASGQAHQGDVFVQQARDKFLGGSGGVPGTPDPVATFQAAAEKEWLVFGCYLGGTTGRFEIVYVPPVSNEDPLQCSLVNGGTAFDDAVQVLWRSSVPGDWTIAFGVLGSGYAEAEVIGVVERACHLGPGAADVAPCA